MNATPIIEDLAPQHQRSHSTNEVAMNTDGLINTDLFLQNQHSDIELQEHFSGALVL